MKNLDKKAIINQSDENWKFFVLLNSGSLLNINLLTNQERENAMTAMTSNQIVKEVLFGPPTPGIIVNRNGGGYEISISVCPDWIGERKLIAALLSEGFSCTKLKHTYRCYCWQEETVADRNIIPTRIPWSATINLL